MRVIIDRRGEQYAVTPAYFRRHYQGAGFQIVRYEDGSPYEGGDGNGSKEPTKAMLLAQATGLGLPVNARNTKAEIAAAIAEHSAATTEVEVETPGAPPDGE